MACPRVFSIAPESAKPGQELKPPAAKSDRVADVVERLDERGRVTVRAEFRAFLSGGYVQVLTPEGVLFRRLSRRALRTKAPALDSVEAEAQKDLP